LRIPTYRSVIFAASFCAFVSYAGMSWAPSFFIRTYGMTTGEVGVWLALSAGLAGGLGCFFGGIGADYLANRTGDQRWRMWLPGGLILVSIPLFFLIYLSPSAAPALIMLGVASFLGNTWLGTSAALIQGLSPLRTRALAFAVLLFLNSLIGQGLGPQIVGILSDALQPSLGQDALRYALLAALVGAALVSAFCFFAAARTLRGDLRPTPRDG
jgi:MFS family permease